MRDHFRSFARYNQWANGRLYAAAASMPDEDYRADRGAFFKSVHGTLNHLLAVDYIWMKRLLGAGEAPTRLDVILHEDLAALSRAREAEDHRIIGYVDGLGEEEFKAEFAYQNMRGDPFKSPRSTALAHLFNHQTHHRGQAHALISAAGLSPPELDYIYFSRL